MQRPSRLAGDLRDAAENEQRDVLYGDPLAPRDYAVRQLVQHDRREEREPAGDRHGPVQAGVITVGRLRGYDFGVEAQREHAGDEEQRGNPGDVDDNRDAEDAGDLE